MQEQKYIRNFAIVAHIDHGKSTLADRLLEVTGTVELRNMTDQILDSNPIEKERGITIKLAPVTMKYTYEGDEYQLNLIDTPGHVDFSYEVSRSLSACEGVLLVVDATQNIQAQTVAHMQLIRTKKLKVIPVINKIDLPTAKQQEVRRNLVSTFGFRDDDILEISAKTGENIMDVLDAIVTRIPSPAGNRSAPLRALVITSQYDQHKGVIVYTRIIDGSIRTDIIRHPKTLETYGRLKLFASGAAFIPVETGIFTPKMQTSPELSAGEVGYIATGMKDLSLARSGDTVFFEKEHVSPLPGYQDPKPMVFLSFYPTDTDQFPQLRESLEKLHLSDSSFTFSLHSSMALGKGYLCGFLGLLHAEVIRERLQKEFSMNIIATAPTVEYNILLKDKTTVSVKSPEQYPDPSLIEKIREPVMYVSIFTPSTTVGPVMQLCQQKRGSFVNLEYIGTEAKFTYLIPLSEMIFDFFDHLKSITSGFASLDYEFYENQEADIVKLDIYLNKKIVDAFSQLIVKENVQKTAVSMTDKLKELIPRHQFQIPVQACIGSQVISRSDIRSFRKDVTAKLYGGDRTRKDKLLEAQKKGKKKMRKLGNVELPQEVFLEVYKKS